MIKTFALGALLSLAAVSAQAATVSAQLAKPLAKADTVLAGGTAWDCQGSTCTTDVALNDTFSTDVCRQLGKSVGSAIASYTAARGSLDDGKLAKCNAGLPGAETLTAKNGGAAPVAR